MTNHTTKPDSSQRAAEAAVHLFDNWFDPIETGVRDRVREFIHAMIEGELDMSLSRPRYARGAKPLSGPGEGAVGATGHRHGHRSRSLLGSFGQVEIEVPRARLNTPDGKTTEWKSQALRTYQRRTLAADALIASSYLAGVNTRRVRRALGALFGGAVGKDTVSRVWRKVKTDWDAWNARSLADEPIVRLILDGTVARVRLDRKATSISLLVVIGVREDGLNQLESLDVQDKYNATIIEPIFPMYSWYADNPNDATINYETFVADILPQWVDSHFSTTGTEKNLLIGFSKSGYGSVDLLLKHPTTFDAAAAFDFPADMGSYNSMQSSTADNYGTQANFQNNYELDQSFLNTYKAPFATQDRLWISEGPLFGSQVADFNNLLTSQGVMHTLSTTETGDAHNWTSGWVSNAVAGLYGLEQNLHPGAGA